MHYSNRRHPHAVNVCSFLREVLNAQPTTSTVLAFGPDHRAAADGASPWWRSDDSLRHGRTVHCIDCGSPDPDCAAHFELRRGCLPDPRWADRDFWPMNPAKGFALDIPPPQHAQNQKRACWDPGPAGYREAEVRSQNA